MTIGMADSPLRHILKYDQGTFIIDYFRMDNYKRGTPILNIEYKMQSNSGIGNETFL